jgi:hypothetical protein
MSTYRKVETGTWNDESFRALTPAAKMLWLYLLSGPRTIAIPGVVIAREAVVADDLECTVRALRKAFSELEQLGMVVADWKTGLVLLPNALMIHGKVRRANAPANGTVLKSWSKHWSAVPRCDLKLQLFETLQTLATLLGEVFISAFHEGFQSSVLKSFRAPLPEAKAECFGKPDANPSGIQDQEQKQEEEQEKESIAPPSGTQHSFALGSDPEPTKPKRAKAPKQPPADLTVFRDAYLAAFELETGHAPLWAGAEAGMATKLITKAGLSECLRRLGIMFAGQGPGFLTTRDLKTFVANFDKFATPERRAGPATAFDAQAERVRMLREQERREAEGSES